MYNRYSPRSDGSYERKRFQDVPIPEDPANHSSNAVPDNPPLPPPKQRDQHPSIQSFIKRLLPNDMDTGDLIVILLLILMAGDCQEDRNNALLTAALYFIM